MKTSSLRLALISSRNPPGRPDDNLAAHMAWIDRARHDGAQFIGFPECSLTGYALSPEIALSLDSAAVRSLISRARRERFHLSFGLVERRARRFCNSQVMAGPAGLMGVVRKINLTLTERKFFTAGRDFPVFTVGPLRIGVAICADATHAETPRVLAHRGAQLIFAPHATYLQHTPASWYAWRLERWPLYARDTGCWFAACNNAGRPERRSTDEKDLGFASGALLLSPEGRAVAKSPVRANRETMLVADLPAPAKTAQPPLIAQTNKGLFYRGLL